MKPTRLLRLAPGLTLVELLVVIVILSVVLAMTATLMFSATRTFARERAIVDKQADLAAANHVFVDDMSIAGYLTTATNAFPALTTGTLSIVTFEGDIDSDGTVTGSATKWPAESCSARGSRPAPTAAPPGPGKT